MKINRKKLYIYLAAAAVVLIAAALVLVKISGNSNAFAFETFDNSRKIRIHKNSRVALIHLNNIV